MKFLGWQLIVWVVTTVSMLVGWDCTTGALESYWRHRCIPQWSGISMFGFFFSAIFGLWSSGGTSWYVIPVAVFSCLYAMLVLLSRTCRFSVIPTASIHCSSRRLANIIPPSVLFFIGSIHIESESIWASTIMYLLPWLETCVHFQSDLYTWSPLARRPQWVCHFIFWLVLYLLLLPPEISHSIFSFWYYLDTLWFLILFRFGWAHSLALALHVYLLGFIRFWNEFVHIFYCDERPG